MAKTSRRIPVNIARVSVLKPERRWTRTELRNVLGVTQHVYERLEREQGLTATGRPATYREVPLFLALLKDDFAYWSKILPHDDVYNYVQDNSPLAIPGTARQIAKEASHISKQERMRRFLATLSFAQIDDFARQLLDSVYDNLDPARRAGFEAYVSLKEDYEERITSLDPLPPQEEDEEADAESDLTAALHSEEDDDLVPIEDAEREEPKPPRIVPEEVAKPDSIQAVILRSFFGGHVKPRGTRKHALLKLYNSENLPTTARLTFSQAWKVATTHLGYRASIGRRGVLKLLRPLGNKEPVLAAKLQPIPSHALTYTLKWLNTNIKSPPKLRAASELRSLWNHKSVKSRPCSWDDACDFAKRLGFKFYKAGGTGALMIKKPTRRSDFYRMAERADA